MEAELQTQPGSRTRFDSRLTNGENPKLSRINRPPPKGIFDQWRCRTG
jgi:hypothetical protein